jgi:hypothetical protein
MNDVVVFEPRKSRGWLSLLLLALIVLVCTLPVVFAAVAGEVSWWVGFLMGCMALGLGVPFLALAFWFPTMRYELDAEALTLRYGPALTYRIPLDEVHAIERRDLSLSLWSSVRLPGLALFAVPYRGMGQVKMCATAATKDILLIETAEGMYGITPADEGGLVAALEARRG